MALAGIKPLYARTQVIQALADLRTDWETIDHKSLITTKGSVGLILADLGQSLALEPDEQEAAFGGKLLSELQQQGVIGNGHKPQEANNDWQPELF